MKMEERWFICCVYKRFYGEKLIKIILSICGIEDRIVLLFILIEESVGWGW